MNILAPPTPNTHASKYALVVLEYFTKLTSWKHGDILVNRIFVTPDLINTGLSNIPQPTLDDYYVVHTINDLSLSKYDKDNTRTNHRLYISIRPLLCTSSSTVIFDFGRDLSEHNTDTNDVNTLNERIYNAYMETLFKYVKVGSYYIQESGDM